MLWRLCSSADRDGDSGRRLFSGFLGVSREAGCTKSGHGAVDELHSIENTADIDVLIFLTLKTVGVNTYSFFDSS